MSKFSLDVLERCVYPFTQRRDPDIVLGAEFGQDVALTRVGGEILVSHVDPIVGAEENIGWLAVHVACNDVAASGVPPRWILILVIVPDRQDEALLQSIMRDADQAAQQINVSIIGGHCGYSSAISRPLVAVTALGKIAGREPIRSDGAVEGDHILVTKGVGMEGTAILAKDFQDAARELGLTDEDLEKGAALFGEVSVLTEALLLASQGVSAMHDVTRGGLLETLLEMAYLAKVQMNVDRASIPIPETVLHFAQSFEFDPLRMISSGTLVATIPEDKVGQAFVAAEREGLQIYDIGRVVSGSGVRIFQDGEVTDVEDPSPERDELARMWRIWKNGR